MIALGGNDGLRALDPAQTSANLAAIIERCRAAGAPPLLAGMRAPPNLGQDYGQAFDDVYPDLARRYGVPLYPFLLDGVAGDPTLNQDDGIHPTAAGVQIIAARLAPFIAAALPAASRAR